MDVLAIANPPDVIAARGAAIHAAMLQGSSNITQPNFDRIGPDDLARLLELYDRHYFGGWLAAAAKAKVGQPVALRLSSTMTRAGGKTLAYRHRRPQNPSRGEFSRFEIAIASRMLFMTFQEVQRPVTVCGLTCRSRLEALQRILEHEIIHLVEFLVWEESSCSAIRFKRLVLRIFGHTDTHHALVTAREHAAVRHGLTVGTTVEFYFEGRRLAGRVNRIHRRATILVDDPDGVPYTDGGKYLKYYMPLESLKPVPVQGER